MPWLVGTALIHSLAVTEKRGAFRSWTVLLAIFAFSLSLLGTFLVRSGVLTSVHAFAVDPRRGIFILAFLVARDRRLAAAVRLARAAHRPGRRASRLLSRESLLLANNVLLTVAAASVLLGTLYPLALDALGLGKISVGPPYFEAVFVPLMAPAVFLMGVGPLARWKQRRAARTGAAAALGAGAPRVVAALCPAVAARRLDAAGRPSACCWRAGSWQRRSRTLWRAPARRSRRLRTGARARQPPRAGAACCSRTSASACSSSA